MRRRFAFLLALLLAVLGAACGEESANPAAVVEDDFYPPAEYEYSGSRFIRYNSDTLIYSIEKLTLDNVFCYLTKIWVQDPERQIRKVNAPWKESISGSKQLAGKIPEIVLASNASGYISPRYPELPESYPGTSADYYYTTLGSVVITDGEVLRSLEGVPFYGLALSQAGITLYRGADNETVLASNPRQTWAFFEPCAILDNGEDVLPEEGTYPLADQRHSRSVLARVNRNNYLMLHVRKSNSNGLTLHRISRFFQLHFDTEWVYNLDGGPSSCLLYRKTKKGRLTLQAENFQQIADIIGFTE